MSSPYWVALFLAAAMFAALPSAVARSAPEKRGSFGFTPIEAIWRSVAARSIPAAAAASVPASPRIRFV